MHKQLKHSLYACFLISIFLSGEIILLLHHHEAEICSGRIYHSLSEKGFHAHKAHPENCFLCETQLQKKLLPESQTPASAVYKIIDFSIRSVQQAKYPLYNNGYCRGPPCL